MLCFPGISSFSQTTAPYAAAILRSMTTSVEARSLRLMTISDRPRYRFVGDCRSHLFYDGVYIFGPVMPCSRAKRQY